MQAEILLFGHQRQLRLCWALGNASGKWLVREIQRGNYLETGISAQRKTETLELWTTAVSAWLVILRSNSVPRNGCHCSLELLSSGRHQGSWFVSEAGLNAMGSKTLTDRICELVSTICALAKRNILLDAKLFYTSRSCRIKCEHMIENYDLFPWRTIFRQFRVLCSLPACPSNAIC